MTTKTMETTREFGTVLDFKEKMEKVDFYVQEGRFDELNAIELASQGKLISCFGNNAGSVYTVFYLPASPNQDYAVGNPERGWDDEQATKYDNPEIENAPANSVTITKAQTTGFSSSGNVTSAQVNAYSNTTVESSSTKSVAFSESVASSGNSGATMSSSTNSAAATGSLSITAKFED